MGVGKASERLEGHPRAPSRGVSPHIHLPPARLTGKWGPWAGNPARHFLARSLVTFLSFARDASCSANTVCSQQTLRKCLLVGCVAGQMD